MNYIGDCPMNCIRWFSNKSYWRLVKRNYSDGCSMELYRRLINEFSKTKIFCFENSFFSYMASAYVRESVRTRGMGHGAWGMACRHSSRNVHNFTRMCAFVIACAF